MKRQTRVWIIGVGVIGSIGGGLLWELRSAVAQEPPAVTESSQDSQSSDSEDLSTPEALAAYGKAATLQNNGAYDLAADQWQAFLEDFAADPRAVEAHYNLGVCYLEQKQLDKARAAFEMSLAPDKDFNRREDAYLNLGWTLYTTALSNQPKLFAEAAIVFEKMLAAYPDGQHRDQALFLLGESNYVQGKRELAAQAYEKLVQELPESDSLSNAMYALGVCFEEMQKFSDAGKIYDQFVDQFPDNPLVAEVTMRKSETLLQENKLKEAEQGFEAVSQIPDFPDADFARYRQAFTVARQDRFADAGDLFAGMVEDYPKSRYLTDATIAAARAYYRGEKFDLAKQWFERLLKADGPYASEAAHWRCRLYLKDEQPEQALQLAETQLPIAEKNQHPFHVNLLMDRADSLYEIESRKPESVRLYSEIATNYPQHVLAPQSLYNAAFAAMELKQYDKALEFAEQFTTSFPSHRLGPDVKHVKAESQLQLGDADAAADSFNELAKANSETNTAGVWQLRKAVALYTQKDYRQALDELTANVNSLKTEDERAEGLYLMGMCHFALQEYDQAAESLQQSIQVQPAWKNADDAMLNRSRALRKLRKTADAKTLVEQMIRQFPKSDLIDQAYFRLAEYCYALGEYDEAIKMYARVVNQWPASTFAPYSLYGHGWSLLRKASYDSAELSFSKLLGQFPDHNLAHQTLYARSMARQQAGKFADSLNDVEAYLSKQGGRRETSDALYVKGLSLVGQKRFPEAIQVLTQLMETDPDYPSGDKVLYELGWAYKSAQQIDAANQTFAKLTEEYSDSRQAAEAHYHVGEAAYERKSYDEAATSYRRAREKLPNDDSLVEKVLYKLGWSEYQQENLDAALQAFAEQVQLFPKGGLAGDAYFMQGECDYQREKYADAMRYYGKASRLPLSSEQITTLTYLHAGQSAGQLGQWKISYDWLATLAQKYPESAYLLQIAFELAVAQQNLGNAAEAERLFASVADRGQGELAARARFMLGEVLYARRQYVQAIREFRKVMFGFDAAATPSVAKWQAKAGFEAGQCAGVVASQQQNRQERANYVELATKFFQYVTTRHQGTDEARAATQQLEKYGQ